MNKQMVAEFTPAVQAYFQIWCNNYIGNVDGVGLHVTAEWNREVPQAVAAGDVVVRLRPWSRTELLRVPCELAYLGRHDREIMGGLRLPDLNRAGNIALTDDDDLRLDISAEIMAADFAASVIARLDPVEQFVRFSDAADRGLRRIEKALAGEQDLKRLQTMAAALLRLDRAWAAGTPLLQLLGRIVRDCVDDLVLNTAFTRNPDIPINDVARSVEGLTSLISDPTRYLSESNLPRRPYVRFLVDGSRPVRVQVRSADVEDEGEQAVHRAFFLVTEANEHRRLQVRLRAEYPELSDDLLEELVSAEEFRRQGHTVPFFLYVQRLLETELHRRLAGRMRQLPRFQKENLTLGKYLDFLQLPESGLTLARGGRTPFVESFGQFVKLRNDTIHRRYKPSVAEMERVWQFFAAGGGLKQVLALPVMH